MKTEMTVNIDDKDVDIMVDYDVVDEEVEINTITKTSGQNIGIPEDVFEYIIKQL